MASTYPPGGRFSQTTLDRQVVLVACEHHIHRPGAVIMPTALTRSRLRCGHHRGDRHIPEVGILLRRCRLVAAEHPRTTFARDVQAILL